MNSATVLQMIKPWLAQAARDTLRMLGMYLLSKHIIQGGDAGVTAFVGAGMTFAGFAWGWFTTFGMVKLAAFFKKMQASAETPAAPSASVTGAVVKTAVVLLAFAAAFSPVDPALAQVKKPAVATPLQALPLTGNGSQDLANVLKRFTIAPAPTTPDEIQNTTCDFAIFSKLTVDNAIQLLEKCAQAVGENVTAPLIADTQTALASARAYGCGANAPASCPGNGMAIACLVPALSLLQAAAGTAPVKDANGVVTTPGIAAGVITIGEKLDEFVQSGGPSNCKAVVHRTVNGLAASALAP